MNGAELLPSNGAVMATVFYTVGDNCRIRSARGWWRVECVRSISGNSNNAVVGRKYRGRNTFILCSTNYVVDVVIG